MTNDFYSSDAWRRLRYKVIKASDGRCECCGRNKHQGAILHVDHIAPRSVAPELSLDPRNLQVLCEDCNVGKGAECDRDWRDHGFLREENPSPSTTSTFCQVTLSKAADALKCESYEAMDDNQRDRLRALLQAKALRDSILARGIQ